MRCWIFLKSSQAGATTRLPQVLFTVESLYSPSLISPLPISRFRLSIDAICVQGI